MQTPAMMTLPPAALRREGKYLTFVLESEEYGLEILAVREIIGLPTVTVLPAMPAFMLGVINLRGRVIPVIDLRLKFRLAASEPTAESCIIVVDVAGTLIGVLVDRVSEVLDIRGDDIEDAPRVHGATGQDFILGMAKAKGRVKILLAIDRVLADAIPPSLAL